MTKVYKVLQAFTDKETKVRYEVGDMFPKLPTDERIQELMGGDLANFDGPVIADTEDEDQNYQVADDVAEVELTDKATIAEITSYLDAHEINHDGITKKADLLALI